MPDPSQIPFGDYCYTRNGFDLSKPRLHSVTPCPYWSLNPDKPYQDNGHCAYLGVGDWEHEGLGLLWDMLKICDVHLSMAEEELQ